MDMDAIDRALTFIVVGLVLILVASISLVSCSAYAATNTGHNWLRHFPYRDMTNLPPSYSEEYHGPTSDEDHCIPFHFDDSAERSWAGGSRRDRARHASGC